MKKNDIQISKKLYQYVIGCNDLFDIKIMGRKNNKVIKIYWNYGKTTPCTLHVSKFLDYASQKIQFNKKIVSKTNNSNM